MTRTIDGAKMTAAPFFQPKSVRFGDRWVFVADIVATTLPTAPALKITRIVESGGILHFEGLPLLPAHQLSSRLPHEVSAEELVVTTRALLIPASAVPVSQPALPVISAFEFTGNTFVRHDLAAFLHNPHRAKSGNRPYLTLPLALFDDGWGVAHSSFRSVQTFSLVFLSLSNKSMKHHDNQPVVSVTNKHPWHVVVDFVMKELLRLRAGFW